MKYRVVVLTPDEWDALCLVVGNGWGDGDFAAWGHDPHGTAAQKAAYVKTQLRAMRKLDNAPLLNHKPQKAPKP